MARRKDKSDSTVLCWWSLADEDASHWEGSCGIAWYLTDGTPTQNGMRFCPRCGKPLMEDPNLSGARLAAVLAE